MSILSVSNNPQKNNPKLKIVLIAITLIGFVLFLFYFFNKSYLGNSEKLCEIKNDRARDMCYIEMARSRVDESWCGKIRSDDKMAFYDIGTRDSCYFSVAEKKEDELLCEQIQNNIKRGKCYNKIAVKKNNEFLCKKIEAEIYDGDYCYASIARAKMDEKICNNIQMQEDKNSCFYNIVLRKLIAALRGEDGKTCDNLRGINISRDVYVYSSEEYLNNDGHTYLPESLLWGLWGGTETSKILASDACYYNLAKSEGSKTSCENIKDLSVQKECYFNIEPCNVLTDSKQEWMTHRDDKEGLEFQYPANWGRKTADGVVFRSSIINFLTWANVRYDTEGEVPESHERNQECKEPYEKMCEVKRDIATNLILMKSYYGISPIFGTIDEAFGGNFRKKYIIKSPQIDIGDINIILNLNNLYEFYSNKTWVNYLRDNGIVVSGLNKDLKNVMIDNIQVDYVNFQKKLISKIENRTADKCILDTVDMFDKMMSTFKYIK